MKHASLQVTALGLIGALAIGSGIVSGSVLSANLIAQNLFNSEVIQDVQRDQEDARRFDENKKNEVRHLTDRAGECKNMTKQLKQSQKNGSKSVAEIATRVTAFCSSVEKAKKGLSSVKNNEDLDNLREDVINPEVSDITQDLWEALNGLNAQNDVFRGLKENKNTCKNFARSMKDVARQAKQAKIDVSALLSEGNAKVAECDTNYKQLGEYAKSELWEEAKDLLQDYFWNSELHESFNQIRENIQSCSDIGRIVNETDRGAKQVDKALKQFRAKKLDTSSAEASFKDALAIVAEARAQAKSGSCDRDAIEDIKSRLDEAGQTLEGDLEDLKSQAGGKSKGGRNPYGDNDDDRGDDYGDDRGDRGGDRGGDFRF